MPTLPGTRIRDNGVFGTITDNPLTAGATTFNSPDLADLSVVVGDHAIVTLDPLKEFGDPEIVMVTAHTAASTVATIQRGMYGTTARQHPQGTLWVHAATTDDYTEIVTSGTRPNDQYEGQLIFETDTDKFVGFDGSAWIDAVPLGAWQPYTPVNTNITVGNGNQVARFTRFGRTIHWRYTLNWGSTTSFTGTIQVGLPVACSFSVSDIVGTANLRDAGTRVFVGAAELITATSVFVMHSEAGNVGRVNATNPFTWVNTDSLHITGTYEAVS